MVRCSGVVELLAVSRTHFISSTCTIVMGSAAAFLDMAVILAAVVGRVGTNTTVVQTILLVASTHHVSLVYVCVCVCACVLCVCCERGATCASQ